jgi:hypothetical protein
VVARNGRASRALSPLPLAGEGRREVAGRGRLASGACSPDTCVTAGLDPAIFASLLAL